MTAHNSIFTISDVPVLKAIAYKSGDGWKDTTEKGQVLYVWGLVRTPPYVGNTLPILGRNTIEFGLVTVSPENFYFTTLDKSDEVFIKMRQDLLAEDLRVLKQSLFDGTLVKISDMNVFLEKLNNPKENPNAWQNNYERSGLGDYRSNNFALNVEETPVIKTTARSL